METLPRFHFTPPAGSWMNDPNGLIFYAGEWHLFYQHHTPRNWGHAVSRDLLKWEHLPDALTPDRRGEIYSGCVVLDSHNTTGFFDDGEGFVAVFTHHASAADSGRESQGLAFSRDRGRSWRKFEGNPVLVSDVRDFRDPKVFRFRDSWIMVLAAGAEIRFYRSPSLKEWESCSVFRPSLPGVESLLCECPDFFSLPCGGRQIWVLTLSYGGRNTRPATRYFTGDFDGHQFVSHGAEGCALSGGPDDYAPITWEGAADNRRLMLGWMNSWAYAEKLWKSGHAPQMTLPRELELHTGPEGPRLFQQPAAGMKAPSIQLKAGQPLVVGCGEVIIEEPVEATGILVSLKRQDGWEVEIGTDRAAGTVFITRRNVVDPDGLRGTWTMPIADCEASSIWRVWLDCGSAEVFARDGAAYFSALLPLSESVWKASLPSQNSRRRTRPL